MASIPPGEKIRVCIGVQLHCNYISERPFCEALKGQTCALVFKARKFAWPNKESGDSMTIWSRSSASAGIGRVTSMVPTEDPPPAWCMVVKDAWLFNRPKCIVFSKRAQESPRPKLVTIELSIGFQQPALIDNGGLDWSAKIHPRSKMSIDKSRSTHNDSTHAPRGTR